MNSKDQDSYDQFSNKKHKVQTASKIGEGCTESFSQCWGDGSSGLYPSEAVYTCFISSCLWVWSRDVVL